MELLTPLTFADLTPDSVYGTITSVIMRGAAPNTVPGAPITPPRPVVSSPVELQYYGDYYFRVWIVPRHYTVQSIQYGVAYPVGVWNAFDHPITLENAASTIDGVNLQEAFPVNFAAYRYRELHLVFDDTVPVEGIAFVEFDFGTFSTEMDITFSASNLFIVVIDEGMTEKFRWRTAISEAVDGTERRAMLRYNPRITYSANITITDDTDRAKYFSQIWSHLAGSFGLPLFGQTTYLTAVTPAAGTALYFDPALTDLRAGQTAVIYDVSDDTFLQVRIAAMRDDGADIVSGLTRQVNDHWQILPLAVVRIPDGTGISMDHMTGSLTLNCERTELFTIAEPDLEPVRFDGIPAVPYRPDVVGSIDENFTQQLTVLDNNILPARTHTNQPTPKVDGQRSFVFDREDVDAVTFWTWFKHYVRGSLRPFYISTGRNDLTPVDGFERGEMQIIVTDDGYKEQKTSGAFDHVQIVFDNGQVETYKILIAETGPLSGQLTLKLDAALPGDENVEIERISVYQKVRVTDDEITFRHSVNHLIVSFNVRTLKE